MPSPAEHTAATFREVIQSGVIDQWLPGLRKAIDLRLGSHEYGSHFVPGQRYCQPCRMGSCGGCQRYQRGPNPAWCTCGKHEPGFTCPVCGMTSWNPGDVKHGYCGRCHDYTRGKTPRGTLEGT